MKSWCGAMTTGSKIGIVCCSNGQWRENEKKLSDLDGTLRKIGLIPVWSRHIFVKDTFRSGTGEERADDLMKFYEDGEIAAVFDISGGDIANEILPYLNFDVIKKNKKLFWGYSDLTTVINAIYAKTGNPSVLYQVRNLVGDCREQQACSFERSVLQENVFSDGCSNVFGLNSAGQNPGDLFDFSYKFLQGGSMEGTVVGGNIRCLLKLAGTEYFPDMKGKILFLEASGGMAPQMACYLSQMKMLGIFEQIGGILLGTFLKMEEEGARPSIEELVMEYAGSKLPIAKTQEIGHRADSKALMVGEKIRLEKVRTV